MARTADPKLGLKRRRQILRAAAECFAKEGFQRTTMQDISRTAGLSAGGLYRYFESKEAIVVAIVEEERAENRELAQILGSARDPVTGLHKVAGYVLAAFDDVNYGRLAVETLAEASRNEDVKAALARNEEELFAAIERALRAGQERDQVRSDTKAETLAKMVMVLFDGLAARGILEPSFRASRYRKVLNDTMTRLLRS